MMDFMSLSDAQNKSDKMHEIHILEVLAIRLVFSFQCNIFFIGRIFQKSCQTSVWVGLVGSLPPHSSPI